MSIQMFNKSPGTSKVNFLDEHVDNVLTENAALRSKLQSKVEALTIMSKQLEKSSREMDRYKLMAEQLQVRYDSSPRAPELYGAATTGGGLSGAQLLANTREQNKILAVEVETLKQKLEDANEDIRVLRKQNESPQRASAKIYAVSTLSFEREELVLQLETFSKKTEQMQADLRAMLDEKEDLVTERDAYKCKLHRLNHQLAVALSRRAAAGPLPDIDALVTENRYLHQRVAQAQAELELATHAMAKYKSILETKHQKGSLKLGTNTTNTVVTHKQVKELLESGTTQELPITAATISDLRALSFGLLDALNDKSLALSHQRKANRILASRITELEKRLEGNSDNEGRVSLFPSKILLETYVSSEVDTFEVSIADQPTDALKEHHQIASIDNMRNGTASEFIEGKKIETIDVTEGKNCNTANEVEVDTSKYCKNLNMINNEEHITEDDETLPPELQKLVQEALDSMSLEE